MDPHVYISTSPYCQAVQRNLLEVGVSLRLTGVRDGVACLVIQQVGQLDYLYSEEELLQRASAVCREVPFETYVEVLPARRKDIALKDQN